MREIGAVVALGAGSALAAAGCTGSIGAGPGDDSAQGDDGSNASGGQGSTPLDCTVTDTGSNVLRRLSRVEYQLTLQDLFQLADPPAVDRIPEDSNQGGFRTISALQNVSDQHLRAYVDVAAELAAEVLADPSRRASVLGCEPAEAGCLPGFVERFGRLAYRRPLESDEASALVARAEASALDTDDQYQLVMEALLTSPSFLFRVEVGDGGELSSLTPIELASRLSFTLWGRGPSAELMDSAEAGALDSAEGLAGVAEQMLANPRAEVFFDNFFKQWLDFEQLRAPNQPPAVFSESMLPDMIAETELVLREFAWTPATRFTDALTANFTYLNANLGAFYGLDVTGQDFVRVEFPLEHQRANTGLLTHASLISAKNDGDLISVRGKWLRAAFLCEDLEVPAGLLEEIQGELAGLTYLEVIEKRNTEAGCAGCHSLIDPIGVGFAQYDGIGYYDGSIGVDEFGLEPRFEGAEPPEFGTLSELAEKLQARPEFAECLAEKLFIYTQGRHPARVDECALRDAGEHFAESDHQFASALVSLVGSPAFRLRRAP